MTDVKLQYVGHRGIHKPDGSKHADWVRMTCGHCGNRISAAVIAQIGGDPYNNRQLWVQCPVCARGSVLIGSNAYAECSGRRIFPGYRQLGDIQGLPDEVREAYDEARDCFATNAFTATELLCRKLIMYVAVHSVGAAEGKTFTRYLDELKAAGYITPPMEPWVDLIRQHGNKATHELDVPSQQRAEGTLEFTALLLQLIYETAAKAANFAPPPSQ